MDVSDIHTSELSRTYRDFDNNLKIAHNLIIIKRFIEKYGNTNQLKDLVKNSMEAGSVWLNCSRQYREHYL